ncbi:hypothetical protein ET33_17750 [Paenibacillus tyrfis]|uniref:ABC transporter domain-containing protein n=1 Tax=Paenibacillus tyrfis TaxID=1501230 RepID=A0A081NXM9_9BACL|nr:hypothetical protein ET33_17750 [Paenibacillus tyrfis]
MTYVLRTASLTKKYKSRNVINHVNLNIQRGEIYAVLGKSGAGKTTLLRMLMGLVNPTGGEIEWFGQKSIRTNPRLYEKIGIMTGASGFVPHLTAAENLDIHRMLMGVPSRRYVDEALENVNLTAASNIRFAKLSFGMQQRLGLARALLHQPELLLLDEPFNGLDSQEMQQMYHLLGSLSQSRKTAMVISSRVVSVVQPIARRIGVLHEGTIVAELDDDTLALKTRQYIRLRVNDDMKASFLLEQYMAVYDYIVLQPGLILIYEHMECLPDIARLMVEHKVDILELCPVQRKMEDYMMELMRENGREPNP